MVKELKLCFKNYKKNLRLRIPECPCARSSRLHVLGGLNERLQHREGAGKCVTGARGSPRGHMVPFSAACGHGGPRTFIIIIISVLLRARLVSKHTGRQTEARVQQDGSLGSACSRSSSLNSQNKTPLLLLWWFLLPRLRAWDACAAVAFWDF